MESNKQSNTNGTDAPEGSSAEPASKKVGFFGRFLGTARLKIRAILRKEDPNIYPFF